MIDCATARDLLLEADPAELQDGNATGTPLAEHLVSCTECRALAARILRAQHMLDHTLTKAASATAGADKAIEIARRPRRRRYWTYLVPLAAAAAVIIAVFHRAPAPIPVSSSALATSIRTPGVEAPPGTNVAVIQTDNPNILIVWLYPQETR